MERWKGMWEVSQEHHGRHAPLEKKNLIHSVKQNAKSTEGSKINLDYRDIQNLFHIHCVLKRIESKFYKIGLEQCLVNNARCKRNIFDCLHEQMNEIRLWMSGSLSYLCVGRSYMPPAYGRWCCDPVAFSGGICKTTHVNWLRSGVSQQLYEIH